MDCVLQYVAVLYSVLHCVAVCCSVLQRVAVSAYIPRTQALDLCYSMLHHVAARCILFHLVSALDLTESYLAEWSKSFDLSVPTRL